jgi:Ca-activated chloride channel family protein
MRREFPIRSGKTQQVERLFVCLGMPVTFASPLWLAALLVVPALIAAAVYVERRPARDAVAFTNIDVLASVLPQPPTRRWIPIGLLVLAAGLAAVAVARPELRHTSRANSATVVLLVDVSGSMGTRDISPSRLDAAEQAMTTFATRLPPRYRVGLVTFSGWSSVVVKPTLDRSLLEANFSALDPEAGTAIGSGIETAVHVLDSSPSFRRSARAIILLSDGAQTTGALTPIAGADLASRDGIRIDTVALGTSNAVPNYAGIGGPGPLGSIVGYGGSTAASPPDTATLDEIAQDTHGQTFVARSATRLDRIYRTLGSGILHQTSHQAIASWFAGIAALALLTALALARRIVPVIP